MNYRNTSQPQLLIFLFPETIEDLQQVQLVSGINTLKESNKLYGKIIKFCKNYRLQYSRLNMAT